MPQAVVCLLPLRSAWRNTAMPAVVAMANATRNSAGEGWVMAMRVRGGGRGPLRLELAAVRVGVRGLRERWGLVAPAEQVEHRLELRRLDAEAGAQGLRLLRELDRLVDREVAGA